jgi:hypothetical protein
MLDAIERNIRQHGFHIYSIGASSTPRFTYTIGIHDTHGAELVLAGGLYYSVAEVGRIIHAIRAGLVAGAPCSATFSVDTLGTFTLRAAHPSWTRALLLGALDYYSVPDIAAYQIVPDAAHTTIDVPDMRLAWSATTEPVWQWLHEAWRHPVPETSIAMTHLAVLRGARITEVMRWEEDEWEMFAGDGSTVSDEDARVVPLGCLVASDPSLLPIVDLAVGEGLWRDATTGAWNAWRASNDRAN